MTALDENFAHRYLCTRLAVLKAEHKRINSSIDAQYHQRVARIAELEHAIQAVEVLM